MSRTSSAGLWPQHVTRNRAQVSKSLAGQRLKLLAPYFLDETISPETLWY